MAKNPLEGAKSAAVRIHEDAANVTLAIHVAETQEDADAMAAEAGEKALKAGKSVTWADGRKEWITTEAVWGADGEHVWDEDGDRIKCERKRVTIENGERAEKHLRYVWRHYDAHYGE